jgi:hypothetical protein
MGRADLVSGAMKGQGPAEQVARFAGVVGELALEPLKCGQRARVVAQ